MCTAFELVLKGLYLTSSTFLQKGEVLVHALCSHGMGVTAPLGKEGRLRGESKLWARV